MNRIIVTIVTLLLLSFAISTCANDPDQPMTKKEREAWEERYDSATELAYGIDERRAARMYEDLLLELKGDEFWTLFNQGRLLANLASCYIKLGRLREADSLIEVSYRVTSELPDCELQAIFALEMGGMAYVLRGNLDEAETLLRRAIGLLEGLKVSQSASDTTKSRRRNERLVRSLWWLRNSLYAQGKLDSAIETGKRLL